MRTDYMLSEYLIKIKELYSAIAFLETSLPEETVAVVHQFERVISRVKLLSLIHDRYVVGVSGFQGAGKTTLINWFLNDTPWNQYDNSNIPWVPERAGVGESLPVLVTCKDDINTVRATLYYVEKPGKEPHSTIAEEKIDSPSRCSVVVSKPKNNYLLVELQVPTPRQLINKTGNHFLDGVSFLLLPGYEVIVDEMSESKKYRQEYMRMALTACANALIVIDGSHAARGNQEEALEEITKIFQGASVQYIITHKDSSEGVEVRQKLINQGISEECITHTGTISDKFTRSMVNEWRISLLSKLSKFCTESHSLRETQRDNINTLTRDVDRVVRQVVDLKDSLHIEETDTIKLMESLLRKFDASRVKIRNIFFEESNAEISKLMASVREDLDFSQKEKGWRDKFKGWFHEKYYGPDTIKSFRQAYNKSFTSNLEKFGGQQGLLFRIYNQSMDKLGVYSELLKSGDLKAFKRNAIQKSFPRNEYRLDVGIINNIQVVAGSDQVARNDPNRKFDRAMTILPYIIFDSQRLQLVMDGNDWASLFGNSKDYQAAVDSFKTHFKNVTIDTKSFLAGVVSLMGADLLPDGKLDSIGGLFAALFGGGGKAATGSAAAAASSSALGLAGAIVGLLILKSVTDASIGYNLKKLGALMSIADSHEQEMKIRMQNGFNAMFQRVRDLIEFRLSDYLHLDTTKGEHMRLQNRIQSCKNQSTDIRENLRTERV